MVCRLSIELFLYERKTTLQGIAGHLRQAFGSYLRDNFPHLYFKRGRGEGLQRFNSTSEFPFQLRSGKVLSQLKGYRREVRPYWYRVFEPVRVIDELCSMKMASPSTFEDFKTIYPSEALPRPLEEYALLVQKESKRTPTLFYQEERGNSCVQVRKPLKMMRKELLSSNHYVRRIISSVIEHGLSFSECEVLDVGCGSGDLVYRLKMAGAKKASGLDVRFNSPQAYFYDREKALGLTENACQFALGNAEQMSFPDDTFDVVVSTSVIEHLNNVEKSFREMKRVLRPKGLCVHFYGPYFGPIGGHSLLTLDFPWGHLRLTRDELGEYLQRVRPNEVAKAKDFLEKEMPIHPKSLSEVAESATRAGFQILCWQEGIRESHYPWVTGRLLDEVKASFPSITVRDLVVDTVWMVLRKE